jgi:hypothetical protein
VGRYVAVAHHPELGGAFGGVSFYDTAADPFHPTLLRRVGIGGCGFESVILDPDVEHGRPYAYGFDHCLSPVNTSGVYVINILTGEILSRFNASEPNVCPPFPCNQDNNPHEGFVQRHPVSGKMLLYIGYWDSGLRIADVTDPLHPVEVGAFDYGPGTPYRHAHTATPTPSGNWTYVSSELAEFGPPGGSVNIFDTHTCDGTSFCTPTLVGSYHAAGAPVQDENDLYSSYLAWDPHNMTPKGENTFALGNYGYGARLVDTSNKAAPQELSFFLPNSNAPLEWVALFGSDGLVYTSDINKGLFILKPQVLEDEQGAAGLAALRVEPGAAGLGTHAISFTTKREGTISLAIFDVVGRLVARTPAEYATAGNHTLSWDGRGNGRFVATGFYFAKVSTPDGRLSAKLFHLAP